MNRKNTKIKMCGLSRQEDIAAANAVLPDYIGFVFWPKSRRFVADETAAALKELLRQEIRAAGVFVDDEINHIAGLADSGVIDLIQLHGHEDEAYIRELRSLTDTPIIQAFVIRSGEDLQRAVRSTADYILLDAGRGSGETFDWELLSAVRRPYVLAGGLHPGNVTEAVSRLRPWAVDVSSGIETDGYKDLEKMKTFKRNVQEGDQI